MSVAGSFMTQSPGRQFFISSTSRLLMVSVWTSAATGGSLKIPKLVRVGVRSQFWRSRTCWT